MPSDKGRKPTAYDQRLERFVRAIDIAADALGKARGIRQRDRRSLLAHGRELKKMALRAEAPFRNVASLAYLEEEFIEYWNGAAGRHVDEFWRRARAARLGFRRRDVIKEVLARRRIRNPQEYELVVDGLVVLQHDGALARKDAALLSRLIGEFEAKQRA